MHGFLSKLVRLSKQIKVTDIDKNASLIRNLSIFCTSQICKVLWYRPQHWALLQHFIYFIAYEWAQ